LTSLLTFDGFMFIFLKGQCFIAIDPNTFAEGFTDRMQTLIDSCRNQEPVGFSNYKKAVEQQLQL